MAGDIGRDSMDQSSELQRMRQVEAATPVQDSGAATADPATTSPALLAHPAIGGRGNAPVRAAVLQRMQQTYGNRAVQRFIQRVAAESTPDTDEDVGSRIQSRAGGGSPLDAGVQRTLESGLGADMSNVRVHTDGEADHLSRSVDAVAFTTGSDIFFRSGAYDPGSSSGMRLLAHEATHTVQQAAGPVAGTPTAGGVAVSDPSDSFEQAAERSADSVMSMSQSGEAATAAPSAAGGSVQREAAPDDQEELPAQTMRASNWVQREAAPDDQEELPAQTMRASNWVQREAAPDDQEELPAQTMRASNWVQREAAPDDQEELPAQTMHASNWVQREAAPDDQEELPAQTMRASNWVQREAAPDDQEELPAQTMRASSWVQRHADSEDQEA
jgi:hypothetical protein